MHSAPTITPRSAYWAELTTTDLAELDLARSVAILPVAAIEQHGPHLPLATDAIINAGIVARALELATGEFNVLVLPASTIGHSPEHSSFPGTLSLRATTLLETWTEICAGVARSGIRKLVILNTHGGQKSLVDLLAVKLRTELEMFAVRANYFAFGTPPGLFDPREIAHGIHGGELETSLLLHLAPALVRRDRLSDFTSWSSDLAASNALLGVEKPVGIGWSSEDLNPAGVAGNAAAADAARGKAYLEHIANALLRLIAEVDAARPGFLST